MCGERVDHSVIGYWEHNIDPKYMEQRVQIIGLFLEFLIDYLFTVIDRTKFTNWHMSETGFHLLVRIHEETMYPVSVSRYTESYIKYQGLHNPGEGYFMGDKWYDVNKMFKEVYKRGYVPLISPQKTRDKGSWRRKARKIYTKNKKS